MGSNGMDAVLGVDVGTSGCKAAVFALDGRELGAAYRAYELVRPRPEHVEQDPMVWWEAAVAATRTALRLAGAPVVQALGLGSANALVLLDAHGAAVRPAIMQLDRRAVDEARQVATAVGAERLFEVTGAVAQPGVHWLPTLAWLRANEPESWRRTTSVVFPSGWLMSQMTGELAVDTSRAATTLAMDQRERTWSQPVLDAIDLDRDLFPPLVDATTSSHPLSRQAANALGLLPNIPVTVGVMDSAASATAVSEHETTLAVVLGTTARVVTTRPTYRPSADLVTCPAPGSTGYMGMGVVWDAGAELRRAASVWGGEADFAYLDVALGPDGRDDARSERARDITASVMRNLVEAADRVRAWAETPPAGVVVTGRASRSRRLIERLELDLGLPIERSPWPDGETRGAAMVAAVAAGIHADVGAARLAFSSERKHACHSGSPTPAHPLAHQHGRVLPQKEMQ